MAWMETLRIAGALLTVLGLIGAAALAAQKFGLARPPGDAARRGAPFIRERTSIDRQRSLLVIAWRDSEHLILSGPEGARLIASAGAPESAGQAMGAATGAGAQTTASIGAQPESDASRPVNMDGPDLDGPAEENPFAAIARAIDKARRPEAGDANAA